MTTLLIVLVVIALLWIAALELRFHSLKDIAGESRQLAEDAAADVRRLARKR